MKYRKVSINNSKEELLNSKNTCLNKCIVNMTIPIEFKYINCLKKQVVEYIDNEFLLNYSSVLEGIIINYSDLKLKRKTCNLVDDCTYYNISVLFKSLLFCPKVNNYIIAKIEKLTNTKIYLSFFNIVKGIVYLDINDYINNNTSIENDNELDCVSLNKKYIKYKSPTLLKEYEHVNCIYKCEMSNFDNKSITISTLESDDISIKLEEGKFIKVLVKDIIKSKVNLKNYCFLICDIDINNVLS